MTLKRNPAYPVAHDGPESVFLRHLESPDFGVQLFEQGDLHLLPGGPSLEVQKRIREKSPHLVQTPSTCTTALFFRMEGQRPFSLTIRTTLSNRLDRESLVRGFCNGGTELLSATLRPSYPSGSGIRLPFPSPPGRTSLDKAFKEAGDSGESPTLGYYTHPTNHTIAQFLASEFKEMTGKTVRLAPMEWASFLELASEKRFDMVLGSLCGMTDPLDWVEVFVTDGPVNWSHLNHPGVNEVVTRGKAATTQQIRNQLAQQENGCFMNWESVSPSFIRSCPSSSLPKSKAFSHPKNLILFDSLRVTKVAGE